MDYLNGYIFYLNYYSNNLNLKKMRPLELLAYEQTIKIVNGRADKTQLAVYMATYNGFTEAEKREYNDLKLTVICSLPYYEPHAIGATEAEYCS